jgi:rubrerythrin
MKDYKGLTKDLGSLCQLDIDAYYAYGQAIPNIDVPEVRDALKGFQADHERHFAELSAVIESHAGTPPEFTRDFKGFMISGFTAVRSKTGTAGALKAMQGNEQLTTKTYEKALKWELPAGVDTLIKRNYEDEQRHLRTIEKWIAEKVWEKAPAKQKETVHRGPL